MAQRACVLLVDDESAIRALFAMVLRGEGYEVVEARDGEQALALAAEMPHIDVVVSDISMPHMNGISLARALRETYGDVKVVFVTGYHVDHAQLGPHAGLLNKPFLKSDLIRMVEHVVPPVPTAAA